MKEDKFYDKQFFSLLEKGSYSSAKIILPLINNVFNPSSIVDVGCGNGLWLKVWNEDLNKTDILGIDGEYVDEDTFAVDKKYLFKADLKNVVSINKKFDVATSFEVGEHLPENCSDKFVETLVSLSKVVVFSAALIGQQGTYHINEQLPEFWARKFIKHNYVPVDYIRPIIWNNVDIQYWYRQNIIVFIHKDYINNYPSLRTIADNTNPEYLTRIHPEKHFFYINEYKKLNSINGFVKQKLYNLKKWLLNK